MEPELTQTLDAAHKDLEMSTTTAFPGFLYPAEATFSSEGETDSQTSKA